MSRSPQFVEDYFATSRIWARVMSRGLNHHVELVTAENLPGIVATELPTFQCNNGGADLL